MDDENPLKDWRNILGFTPTSYLELSGSSPK